MKKYKKPKDGTCDVVRYTSHPHFIGRNIKTITRTEDGFILSDGHQDILYTHNRVRKDCIVTAPKIRNLQDGFYELTYENGRSVLYNLGKIVEGTESLGIEIRCHESQDQLDPAYFYASIEEQPHKYRFVVLHKQPNKAATICHRSKELYKEIIFYKDFALRRGDDINPWTSLFNYEGKFVLGGDQNISIEVVGHLGETTEDGLIYSIDGQLYTFKNGQPIAVPVIKRTDYIAAYEGEYGTVVIDETEQSKFDWECQKIESLNKDAFEEILKKHYEASQDLQQKYPNLVMKPKNDSKK